MTYTLRDTGERGYRVTCSECPHWESWAGRDVVTARGAGARHLREHEAGRVR